MGKVGQKKGSLTIESLLKELEQLRKENALLKKIANSQNTDESDSDGKKQFTAKSVTSFFPESRYHINSFEKLPFLMWAKDLQGRYLSVNEIFAESHGQSVDYFTGLTDYDFLPAVFAQKFHSDDSKVIQTGAPLIIEEMRPRKEGFLWHETVKIPMVEDGTISGIVAFSKDITSRKEHEKALRESEEKFRELAENTTDAFVLRSGQKVLYVNPAFEQVYGYTRKDLDDDPDLYKKWIHPEDRERILNVLKTEQYKSTFIFNEQYRIIKKDGIVSWIWNRSFPVWNDKGEVYRIVSVSANISEIKNLEEHLRNSKWQMQAILDNIPHLAWLKSLNGKYISVNKSFASFFNKVPDQIIGKSDFDLCPRKLAEDYLRKDQLVISMRMSRQFYEIEKKNSIQRYSETIKTPVLNDKGEVIGVAGISRDITDQKLAEKALIRSEEKFKDLVTLLPEVVFETDEQGTIIFANLKGFELMEYSQADLIRGKTIFDLIVPEDADRVREIFQSFRFGSELRGKEFRVVTKSGKILPVLIFTNNMYQDNQWNGVRGVMVDISRRKEAEKQEKIYQSKLLYLSDTALDFLSMNPEANLFSFIGSRLKEMLDNVFVIVNRYDDRNEEMVLEYHSFDPQSETEIFKVTKTPPEYFSIKTSEEHIQHLYRNAEHLHEFKNGFFESTFGRIPLKASVELEKKLGIKGFYGMTMMRSGKLFGSILLLTKNEKLTDKHFIETFIYQASIALHRKQLEIELLEAKKVAEESDRLKTSFLANMSHEIRTPMNGILGLTEMLARYKVEGDKYKEYLAMISANGKMLLNLVNDIIDISKIEAKQVDLHETEFSVKELLNDIQCIISAERMVKGKENVELIVSQELGEEEDLIYADQAKIKQVLINLVGNAVKFTHAGNVTYGCKLEPNQKLLFYVKDTGIGIPSDKCEVIFNRFTQADQSLTRPYTGSGLGLAISKGFVELMKGKIWAESEMGQGSKFYFTIPYQSASGSLNVKFTKKKKELSDFNWKNMSILVVEDNLISYKLLEISLSKTGCKILHAENGADAINLVKEFPEIDIVLMDIQLPVMNGYEATRAIKKIRPALPVIAQTANAMDSDRMKCLDAGCSDYVTKPIVIDNLLPVIENYVSIQRK